MANGSVLDLESVRGVVEGVLIGAGLMKEKKTKRVAGEDLTADCFAYVGDKDNTSTWKLPIKFSTDDKSKSHIRNALARFNQTQGIPADQKAKVKAKLVAAAKKHGIETSDSSAKCIRFALVKILAEKNAGWDFFSKTEEEKTASLRKAKKDAEFMISTVEDIFAKVDGSVSLFQGLYTVSSLAEILQSLQWIVASTTYERDYEGDESEVPDDLREILEDLIPVFVAMASEEANELLQETKKAANGGEGGKSMSTTDAGLLKAAFDALVKKAKSLFHKCASCHKSLMKAHEDRADEHKALAEHHTAIAKAHAEADAEKAIHNELEKLTGTAEFAKMDATAKMEKTLAVLEKAKNPFVAAHTKVAKAHTELHKCAMKSSGHHEDLHKAYGSLGDAEDAPDTQNRSKDEAEAHPGGSSEKNVGGSDLEKSQGELLKAFKGALSEAIDPIRDEMKTMKASVEKVQADVDQHLSKLAPGPASAAGSETGEGREARRRRRRQHVGN